MHILTRLRRMDRRLFWSLYAAAAAAAALLGTLSGILFAYALDLPRVEELETVRPWTASRLVDRRDRPLARFAAEDRLLIETGQVTPRLKQAVLAAEDSDFYDHIGIDFRRVLVTVARNLLKGQRKGASTLTMQLAKMRFTSYERRLERKIKDALYALKIESRYSKDQILTFYLNQANLGHGVYGMSAAAEFYYGRGLEQLSLDEMALLAGILPSPTRYSPINSPRLAQIRRDYVLRRMLDEGYIGEDEMRQALQAPIEVQPPDRASASYAAEAVRLELADMGYPSSIVHRRGLRVTTTLDGEVQKAARQALQNGLLAFDKRSRRWRGAEFNLLDQGRRLDAYRHPEWSRIFRPGQIIRGLVLESGPQQAQVRLGTYTARIGPDDIAWTGKRRVDEALKQGDVAAFRLRSIDRAQRIIEASLERIPGVQGALLALDTRSGAILAMVGGFDFQYSQFNRATQALRQPGSIFKPFTYLAALEAGYSPLDTELDEPVQFLDGLNRVYAPRNSDRKFKGVMPLYQAIGESRNIPTLRLADKLGIERVIAAAGRFGIRRPLPPYLPVAIGAGEVTLTEITSALSAFANRGYLARPYLIERIEDFDGSLLYEAAPELEEAASAEIADQMLCLLRGVIEQPEGTGRAARRLNRPLAGKTGTTNDSTDSWFVGITPSITAGVWVGRDSNKPLGRDIWGSTLALPIWLDFFRSISHLSPSEDFAATCALDPGSIAYAAQTEPSRDLKVEDIPPPF